MRPQLITFILYFPRSSIPHLVVLYSPLVGNSPPVKNHCSTLSCYIELLSNSVKYFTKYRVYYVINEYPNLSYESFKLGPERDFIGRQLVIL